MHLIHRRERHASWPAGAVLAACTFVAACATTVEQAAEQAGLHADEQRDEIPFEFSMANPVLVQRLREAVDAASARQVQELIENAAKELARFEPLHMDRAPPLVLEHFRLEVLENLKSWLWGAARSRAMSHRLIQDLHEAELRARTR